MKRLVTFGEIMMRLSIPNQLRFENTPNFDLFFGGSESNVAISLANFGMEVDYVSRIPEGVLGDRLINELYAKKVGTQFIQRGGERLGIYFTENSTGPRKGRVVYDRQNSGMATVEQGMFDWGKIFKGASWFHWTGITPALSKSASLATLEAIQTAGFKGLTVSVDLNVRNQLWKYGKKDSEVMPPLVSISDILIGNAYSIEKMLGIKSKKGDKDLTEKVFNQFPKLRAIALTSRIQEGSSKIIWGATLATKKGFFESKKYTILPVIDRIGTGDSFTAGLIYGLNNFKDDQETLEFATAAGCLKHTLYGDINTVTFEEVIDLAQGDSSGILFR